MWYLTVGNKNYLAVKMNDDSLRVASFDGKYPVGTITDNVLDFPIVASIGVHEQQPAVVPLRFTTVEDDAPVGYETIAMEAVFQYYNWDAEEQSALWGAKLVSNEVEISPLIATGDEYVSIELN